MIIVDGEAEDAPLQTVEIGEGGGLQSLSEGKLRFDLDKWSK